MSCSRGAASAARADMPCVTRLRMTCTFALMIVAPPALPPA
jgi:hypothetical protein